MRRPLTNESIAFLTLCAVLCVAACGGSDGPSNDDPDQGPNGDAVVIDFGDGGTEAIDITGDWLILRFGFESASTEVPLDAELGETRFEQAGAAFTQFFGDDDTIGVPGTIEDGVYTQTDGSFTAEITFEDPDFGMGTFEQGSFRMRFALVRQGAPSYSVEGDWVEAGARIDERVVFPIETDGDDISIEVDGALLRGSLAGDAALLLADPDPEDGSLAAVVRWLDAESAALILYETSWIPTGGGHTDFAFGELNLDLIRATAQIGCTADSECLSTEECVERECEARIEGSGCADDDACPDPLYCARGLCQDGSTDDLCDSDDDCLDDAERCDTVCTAREAGDPCGADGACPDGLYCADDTCLDGQTGDACNTTRDCLDPADACQGDPAVCTTVLVLVEAGTTRLGSPASEVERGSDANEAQRNVTLTRPFLIDPTEVTQGEYQRLLGDNPSFATECGDACPVESVTYFDALRFANARSAEEGLPACYALVGCNEPGTSGTLCSSFIVRTASGRPDDCEGYRLPLPAEWEVAARAGTTTATYAGEITTDGCEEPVLTDIAWYCGNADGGPRAVAQLDPNAFGLYDMIGNVAEYTFYPELLFPSDQTDPIWARATGLVQVRGGGWLTSAGGTRAAAASINFDLNDRNRNVGFRLVRTLPGAYGQPCAEDRLCREGLYCAGGLCQDGRGGDYCGDSAASCQSGDCTSAPDSPDAVRFGADRCTPAGMVFVPGEVFEMGSADTELGREASTLDETRHTAYERSNEWVAITEVTNAEWTELLGTEPPLAGGCPSCPVRGVSWNDAVAYANARSSAEGLAPCYYVACAGTLGDSATCNYFGAIPGLGVNDRCDGYRLPSETEWERYARAGTETATYVGDLERTDCRDTVVAEAGWFCGNSGDRVREVAGREANAYGLYDLLGNVAEWTSDWAGALPSEPVEGYSGVGSGTERVLRGGGYASTADRLRSASRESAPPSDRGEGFGLRLVRNATFDGAYCRPFSDEHACAPDFTCIPLDSPRDEDGELVGRCASTFGEGADGAGDRCEGFEVCAGDLLCSRAYDRCVETCDPDATDACAAGFECRATAGTFACLEVCDPFAPFPTGGCAGEGWCDPIAEDSVDGICTSELRGSSRQGGPCDTPADCAEGFGCGDGECLRYCRVEEDDCGELTCVSRTCVDPDTGEVGPCEVGACRNVCDLDAGIPCASAARVCFPEEINSTEFDICIDPLYAFDLESLLEVGDSCVETGLSTGRFCDGLAACYDDGGETCSALCRREVATDFEVVAHPDCGESGFCSFIGDPRVGDCVQCETTVFLDEPFEGFVTGTFDGNVTTRGWADMDYPNIADDEAEGGTDGDAGLVLQGWIEGGNGAFRRYVAIDTPVGSEWALSADMHRETGFDATELDLTLEFWDAVDGGRLISSSAVSLLTALVPNDDATDQSNWRRVGVRAIQPEGARRVTAVVSFAGTTDLGTLRQAVRVDNLMLLRVLSCE